MAEDGVQAEALLSKIRDAVAAHEASGAVQWYVDENCIDCDAGEFWAVIAAALVSK